MKCAQCGNITVNDPCSFCGAQTKAARNTANTAFGPEQASREDVPGAPQLHFDAQLAPLDVSERKSTGHQVHHAKYRRNSTITAMNIIVLAFSVVTPLVAAWATVTGFQKLVLYQLEHVDSTVLGVLETITFDMDGVNTVSATLSMFLAAAKQSGNGATWLLFGILLGMLCFVPYIIAIIVNQRNVSAYKIALVLGSIMTISSCIFSIFGLIKILNFIPIPAPYSYAGFFMLGLASISLALSFISYIKISRSATKG